MYIDTQVLSRTVAIALENSVNVTQNIYSETKATAEFCYKFDAFFDCLNVRSLVEGKHKRKPNLNPYRSPSDKRFKVNNSVKVYITRFQFKQIFTPVYML